MLWQNSNYSNANCSLSFPLGPSNLIDELHESVYFLHQFSLELFFALCAHVWLAVDFLLMLYHPLLN